MVAPLSHRLIPDRESPGRHPARNLVACAVLVLIVVFVYAGTATNGFVNFDDPEYVSAHAVVRQGLTRHGMVWALGSVDQANWHPLTWWSHMLDVSLFGMSPGPHHLVSALLHALSALLLYLALAGMTGAAGPSALVAALFAAHPIHVESVAWIAERKDVLCGLFWMLALYAYSRYVRRPNGAGYLAVAASFTLALMAKPMAVTFPLVLLLLDWWPLGRVRIREKLPLLVLSLLSGLTTLYVQSAGGAVKTLASHPLGARLENALHSTVIYPAKILWPQGLAVFYPFPTAPLPRWQWLAAALAVVGTSVIATLWRRRHPWLATGWAWYLVTLLPVLGLIQVGAQSRADRYMYLPSIGVTLSLAWGAVALARRFPAFRVPLRAGAVAAVSLLAVSARAQAGLWRDSETLFRHSLSTAGESSLVRANLGGALVELGRWEDALPELESALRANPGDAVAWFNVGIASSRLQRWTEAAAAFRQVIAADPADHEARYNLGMIAVTLDDRDTAEAQRAALVTLGRREADNLGKFMAARGW